MENVYFPEGRLAAQPENTEYISSLEGLEYARQNGIILEARVVLCDARHNLYVELGDYRGMIPRQETLYNPSGEEIKDIAIITRVGKSVCFVVTDIVRDADGIHIYLSRRKAQIECCKNYISRLCCGDVIEAAVTHLEKFGAFCDIACGLVGLLPIDCISVSRISHPEERFSCGQTIRCVVKNVDKRICRVTLTHKELLGTWEENAAQFRAGETTAGIIRSIEPYGIFVELSPNLAGLAEWCDGVCEGQTAAVYIKSIIPEKMKIKLVIIDTSPENINTKGREYYFTDRHMDEWIYSPEECTKEIFTVF